MIHISKTYPEYPLSQFPDIIDGFQYKKEPSASDIILMNQYNDKIAVGDFAGALEFITQNPHLKEMQISAYDYNKLLDSLMAIEEWYQKDIHYYLATAAKQIIVSDVQPEGQNLNDFWIKTIGKDGNIEGIEIYCMGEGNVYRQFSPAIDAGTY